MADRRLGISRFFGDRVSSLHVGGRAKPAPDLFLYAAAQLGAPPERCLVIEDSPRGIEAAGGRGCGWWGWRPRMEGRCWERRAW